MYPHVKQFEFATLERERELRFRRELRLAHAASTPPHRKLPWVGRRLRLQTQA